MRRRAGCSHGSEDAAVAHLCLPQAPPISAPAPVTDAEGGNRAGKTRGAPGASPWGPRGATLGGGTPSTRLEGAQVGSGGCTAPVTRHGAQGGCRLCQHHVAAVPAARLDPGNTGGFPCQDPRRGEERLRSTRQEASPSRNSLHTPPCSLGCPQPGPSVPKPSSK